MYPGLMSISRFDALLATSAVMPAVMRFVAGVDGSSAPKVNWVIFDSEPVGVVLVSAVALAAIRVSRRIIGIASRPSSGLIPNQYQFRNTEIATVIGTPMNDSRTGSSMWETGSSTRG